MCYEEIKQKYINLGCTDYKLRNANDLKEILGIDLRAIIYWNELSYKNRELLEKFIVKYMNGYGLESREGYKVIKAYLCKEYELLDDGGIKGEMFININDLTNPKKEIFRVDNRYKGVIKWNQVVTGGQRAFLRVDLLSASKRKEWFHVFEKNGDIKFY